MEHGEILIKLNNHLSHQRIDYKYLLFLDEDMIVLGLHLEDSIKAQRISKQVWDEFPMELKEEVLKEGLGFSWKRMN